jgi:hypothetical protein
MNNTPTLVEEQIKSIKAAGGNVIKGTVTAHKPHVEGENRSILERWLPTWIKNAFRNYSVASTASGLNWLRASAKGLPAVVVGIGPSLDKNVKDLFPYQKNCVIISTDAALRPLMARGIKPHLVVSIDASENQYTLFDDVPNRDIVLVAPVISDPVTLCAWKGPKILFNPMHPGIEFMDLAMPSALPHLGQMCVHGTVGNTATILAYQLGCKQILAIGMDLCYGKAGDPQNRKYRCQDFEYVSATRGFQPKIRKEIYDDAVRLKNAYEVEVKGEKFIVDAQLDLYRKALRELVGSFMEVPFTDCTEGGILGAMGFYTQKFSQALIEHCSRQIEPGESVVYHLPEILQGRE